jgi:hypothetical protein
MLRESCSQFDSLPLTSLTVQLRREARRIRLRLATVADVIELEAEEREIEVEERRIVDAENKAMNDRHLRERMKALLERSDIAVALQTQTHGYAVGAHHHFCHTRTRAFRSRIAMERLTVPAAERTEHHAPPPTGWVRTTRALLRIGDGASAHTMTVAEFRFLAAQAISHERQSHSDAMWRLERDEQRLRWERSRVADRARWVEEDASAVRQNANSFSPVRRDPRDACEAGGATSGGHVAAQARARAGHPGAELEPDETEREAPPRATDPFGEFQHVDVVDAPPAPPESLAGECAGQEEGGDASGDASGGASGDADGDASGDADGVSGSGGGGPDADATMGVAATPAPGRSTPPSMDAAVPTPSSKVRHLLSGTMDTGTPFAGFGQGDHRRRAQRAIAEATNGQFGHGEHRAAAKHALQVAMNKGALLLSGSAKGSVFRSDACKGETEAEAPRVPPVAPATITLVSRGVVLDDDSASAFELRLFDPSVTLIALQVRSSLLLFVLFFCLFFISFVCSILLFVLFFCLLTILLFAHLLPSR